ncbi:MAG TPA: prepilin-type N-terminal cleavage/methylation domain-containing protein [Phycisphaeraceae bacterium]
MIELIQQVAGPRVPAQEWAERKGRYLLPTVLLLASSVMLLVSMALPYWTMVLHAPQYPQGLHVQAHLYRLDGDVQEIDTLNHYIGMRPLGEAAQLERSLSIFAIVTLALLLLAAVFIHNRWAALLALPAVLFPVMFLLDLHYWLSNFGQNLDPNAPLSSAIKPFTPPVLGTGLIGQFKTVASPGPGLILAAAASVTTLAGLWFHRAAYKPLVEARRRSAARSLPCCASRSARQAGGFSLIELLVTMSLIALLIGLLLPTLATARQHAQWAVCASNARQTALAIEAYAHANDQHYPLARMYPDDPTWLEATQPYGQHELLYRCPSDQSPLWNEPDPAQQRRTTYGLNGYLTPNHPPYWGVRPVQVVSPSHAVVVAELSDDLNKDHFMPMFWGTPPKLANMMMQSRQWDAAKGQPKVLSIHRHQDTANYVFADGHAATHAFEDTWQQTPGSPPAVDWYDPLKR